MQLCRSTRISQQEQKTFIFFFFFTLEYKEDAEKEWEDVESCDDVRKIIVDLQWQSRNQVNCTYTIKELVSREKQSLNFYISKSNLALYKLGKIKYKNFSMIQGPLILLSRDKLNQRHSADKCIKDRLTREDKIEGLLACLCIRIFSWRTVKYKLSSRYLKLWTRGFDFLVFQSGKNKGKITFYLPSMK